jgi:hypothetical protein
LVSIETKSSIGAELSRLAKQSEAKNRWSARKVIRMAVAGANTDTSGRICTRRYLRGHLESKAGGRVGRAVGRAVGGAGHCLSAAQYFTETPSSTEQP